MSRDYRLAAARADRDAKRAALMGGIATVKARLAPQTLAEEALSVVTRRINRRPTTVVAVVGTVALYLARHRVARWFKRRGTRDATRRRNKS